MIEQVVNGSESLGTLPEQGLKFTLEEVPKRQISIKVLGIGGCGGNIVDYMIDADIVDFEYICLNTDEQALKRCLSPVKLQIGNRVTQGYGTGSDPEMGREAALENTEELTELIGEADMVFLVLGLGGGTGTGAAPVVGSIAKQMGALTVAAAVKPFAFEGKRKNQIADEGFQALLEQVDTAIEIPNEHLLGQIDPSSGFFDSFKLANQIAADILQGITDIINRPGIMNSDFADIRAVLEEAGLAVVGSSQCGGDQAAVQAAREAIDSLVVDQDTLSKANKVLVNVSGSNQFGMQDASEALHLIHRSFDHEANLIIGTVRDDSLDEQVRVMVVASGFNQDGFELRSAEVVAEDEAPSEAVEETAWMTEVAADSPSEERESLGQVMGQQDPEPFPAESEAKPQSDSGALEYGLPTNAGPVEYMPRQAIRVKEAEIQKPARARHGLFRRKSIFR